MLCCPLIKYFVTFISFYFNYLDIFLLKLQFHLWFSSLQKKSSRILLGSHFLAASKRLAKISLEGLIKMAFNFANVVLKFKPVSINLNAIRLTQLIRALSLEEILSPIILNRVSKNYLPMMTFFCCSQWFRNYVSAFELPSHFQIRFSRRLSWVNCCNFGKTKILEINSQFTQLIAEYVTC